MFSSWQTSLIGLAVGIVGAALLFTGKITWEQFILFLSIFGIGVSAKDHNK